MKHILTYMAVGMLAVACSEDPDEFRQTTVDAPVLKSHGMILVTPSSKTESVTFAWSALRAGGETSVSYELFGKVGEEGAEVSFGSTQTLSLTVAKADFNDMVLSAGAPVNDKFEMSFYVKAYYDKTSLNSNVIKVVVQSQGDLVEPSFTEIEEGTEIVLTSATWDEMFTLSWDAARLEAGAEIEYVVYAYCQAGANPSSRAVPAGAVELGRTAETSLSLNQETLNEAIVKAGAPEGQSSEVSLYVSASSAEVPEGVESSPVSVIVTTYSVNYPERLYAVGSHQGWSPADAQSVPMTATKGIYECFVDLTTSDGSDVEFKFTSEASWNGTNLGKLGDITTETDADGNVVLKDYSFSMDGGAGNIVLPSGVYRVRVNYKTKTFTAVKIERVGIIGSATASGWDGDTEMTYSAGDLSYTLTASLMKDGEYKFRMNNNWTYSIGDNGEFEGGSNYAFSKESGEYKVILKVGVYPYEVKLVNTSYPAEMNVVGSHQGWNCATAPSLSGNGEGLYEGFLSLVDAGDATVPCQFKFNPDKGWDGNDVGGTFNATTGEGEIGGSSNIEAPSAYYYVKINLPEQSFTLTEITKVGLIGTINSWGGDEEFTYDATGDVWTLENVSLTTSDEFKVRFNGGWDLSLGGDASDLTTENGANMKVQEDGTYNLTLNIVTKPYRLTLSKN